MTAVIENIIRVRDTLRARIADLANQQELEQKKQDPSSISTNQQRSEYLEEGRRMLQQYDLLLEEINRQMISGGIKKVSADKVPIITHLCQGGECDVTTEMPTEPSIFI